MSVTSDVDTVLPAPRLLVFGLQHLLVMAASPITAVFVLGRAMDLPGPVTVNLISATILACGLGTLLQSLGVWRLGARLPFVMVPGGGAGLHLHQHRQADRFADRDRGRAYDCRLLCRRAARVQPLPAVLPRPGDRHDAAAGGREPGRDLWRRRDGTAGHAGLRRPDLPGACRCDHPVDRAVRPGGCPVSSDSFPSWRG